MMNIYEIYVLNRALDGKDIFALPSFTKLNAPNFMIDDIKNVLNKKGILESEDTFTADGLSLTNRLRLYKEAEKHIQIENVTMGIINETESVLLLYNPLFHEYKIEVIDSTDMTGQLASFYSFLAPEETVKTEETAPEEEIRMSSKEFNETFTLNEENHFHMLTQDKDKRRDEVYFLSNGKYYVFNAINGILSSRNYKDLMSQVEERMRME